ncbi:MAG: pyruvate formate lyase family protein [Candidatus Brocadiia bacterium]
MFASPFPKDATVVAGARGPETGPLDRELAFTEAYRRNRAEHVAVREARCLKLGRLLYPLQEGDLFAGRHRKAVLDEQGLMVGFGLEHEDCGRVYYCERERMRRTIEGLPPGDYRRRCEEMLAFWEKEDTQERYFDALPPDVHHVTRDNRLSSKGLRLAGVTLNYDKLMRVGIGGLRAEIAAYQAQTEPGDGRDPLLYEGMLMALDLFEETALDYAEQARALGDAELSAVLEHIASEPPRTLRQGIQLFWLYSMLAGVTNYGRMDIYLGDLYASDLDQGRLNEESALELLLALWQLMAEARFHFNSRIIVGGRGRRNEANADRFALAAMEASHRAGETEPQLSLRLYDGQNPALLQRALDVIGDGCVYPILYNDEVNVPAVERAFGAPQPDAEQYVPYGCGEYTLDHISFGSPNTSLNMLKAVQVVMNNGVDPDTGEPTGLDTGPFEEFERFEEFWGAYGRQIEHCLDAIARAHAIELEIERTAAGFLYASMLIGRCLERGRSLVDGGLCYLGGLVESMGMVNAADCLTAIKKLIYEEERFTPAELLKMLEADWEGYEAERRAFLDAPKYGNDLDEADRMLCRVSRHCCEATIEAGRRAGLDYFLLVNINNWAYVRIGKETGATPDGRRAGMPIASGNAPTAGNDTTGITAFLNSVVKPDPGIHAGYVHNMKFGKRMFTRNRPKFQALLETYFAQGGTQAMLTVVGKDDLENAMREPENYRNLMVRVGGFSARFVELEESIQRDIIRRTFYE